MLKIDLLKRHAVIRKHVIEQYAKLSTQPIASGWCILDLNSIYLAPGFLLACACARMLCDGFAGFLFVWCTFASSSILILPERCRTFYRTTEPASNTMEKLENRIDRVWICRWMAIYSRARIIHSLFIWWWLVCVFVCMYERMRSAPRSKTSEKMSMVPCSAHDFHCHSVFFEIIFSCVCGVFSHFRGSW